MSDLGPVDLDDWAWRQRWWKQIMSPMWNIDARETWRAVAELYHKNSVGEPEPNCDLETMIAMSEVLRESV